MVSSEAPLARDPKGTVAVVWPEARDDKVCCVLISMDQPWPASVAPGSVTAMFVQSLDQIDEAVAFIAANKTGTRH